MTPLEKIQSSSKFSPRKISRGLFWEKSYDTNHVHAVYSLSPEDKPDCPSLSKIYNEMEDLTEYNFALATFGSYDTWQELISAPWFKPYVTKWRRELELKLKAKALNNIFRLASDETSKYNFEANKYILNYTKEPVSSRRGRPTKEEITREAQDIATEDKRLSEDAQRIMN